MAPASHPQLWWLPSRLQDNHHYRKRSKCLVSTIVEVSLAPYKPSKTHKQGTHAHAHSLSSTKQLELFLSDLSFGMVCPNQLFGHPFVQERSPSSFNIARRILWEAQSREKGCFTSIKLDKPDSSWLSINWFGLISFWLMCILQMRRERKMKRWFLLHEEKSLYFQSRFPRCL